MSKKKVGKKEQFTQPQKSKTPMIVGVLVAVAAVIFIATQFIGGGDDRNIEYFGEPVAEPRSYIGQFIGMTTVEPIFEDGQIKISFDEVNQNNIVYFEGENELGEMVPIMAYITPTGRLFVGSSMCEPCRGTTYSLAGETIVCGNCQTTFTIEDHEFIAGVQACGQYPPTDMYPVIEDGLIIIDEQEVLDWRIRAL
ncbi:Fe-S-containing protein [Dethiobacter alkaliphilus]|uniref:Membrane iron-sulfur containing protein FtrD-like domain-containing protein n=1 Tax=Dethiobacter alkaliphilus AHT 1 TaxID=555088 RepID=C0GF09_DETAL|nr:Fe-S-containing protein [Dethiobacter alkaliphilus]EEG78191.1 hypothetical protein DealDRAFT_1068 [Dethiobacter alkaliphilus AHT 1]MCW3491398.1 DUF2318 domain-containing protein [Dethiobacter alkaliphilus]